MTSFPKQFNEKLILFSLNGRGANVYLHAKE